MAGEKKIRFPGNTLRYVESESDYDLDLSFVTDRIVVMSHPLCVGTVSAQKSVSDVTRFIRERFESNFRIYCLWKPGITGEGASVPDGGFPTFSFESQDFIDGKFWGLGGLSLSQGSRFYGQGRNSDKKGHIRDVSKDLIDFYEEDGESISRLRNSFHEQLAEKEKEKEEQESNGLSKEQEKNLLKREMEEVEAWKNEGKGVSYYDSENLSELESPFSTSSPSPSSSLSSSSAVQSKSSKSSKSISSESSSSSSSCFNDNFVFEYGEPPLLKDLFYMLKSMHEYLASNSQNVVIVHCLDGKGQSGVIVASFLMYTGLFHTVKPAINYFSVMRSEYSWNPLMPSQTRYVKYVNEIIEKNIIPLPHSVILRSIVLHRVPKFEDKTGCCLHFRIFELHSGKQPTREKELIFSSRIGSTRNFVSIEEGKITAELPAAGVRVFGDLLFEFFHVTPSYHKEFMFCFFIHQGMHKMGVPINISKTELDFACEDKRFSKNFSVELFFGLNVKDDNSRDPNLSMWKSKPKLRDGRLCFFGSERSVLNKTIQARLKISSITPRVMFLSGYLRKRNTNGKWKKLWLNLSEEDLTFSKPKAKDTPIKIIPLSNIWSIIMRKVGSDPTSNGFASCFCSAAYFDESPSASAFLAMCNAALKKYRTDKEISYSNENCMDKGNPNGPSSSITSSQSNVASMPMSPSISPSPLSSMPSSPLSSMPLSVSPITTTPTSVSPCSSGGVACSNLHEVSISEGINDDGHRYCFELLIYKKFKQRFKHVLLSAPNLIKIITWVEAITNARNLKYIGDVSSLYGRDSPFATDDVATGYISSDREYGDDDHGVGNETDEEADDLIWEEDWDDDVEDDDYSYHDHISWHKTSRGNG